MTDSIGNWKLHLQDVKARTGKKLGLVKTLAYKKWGGDQNTPNDCGINFTLRGIDLWSHHKTSN
jgi:hypothetical protein